MKIEKDRQIEIIGAVLAMDLNAGAVMESPRIENALYGKIIVENDRFSTECKKSLEVLAASLHLCSIWSMPRSVAFVPLYNCGVRQRYPNNIKDKMP